MKSCERCGMIYDETIGNCPNCSRLNSENQNGGAAWPVLKSWFSSNLMLVIAILITVSVGLGIFAGSYNILGILITIGLWMAYASAKSEDSRMNPTGLKIISGTLKATVIIFHVLAGLLFVLGIICLAARDYLLYNFVTFGDLFATGITGSIADMDGLMYLLGNIAGDTLFTILAVVIFVAAICIEIENIFFMRNAHKLAKSLCLSADTGVMNIAKSSTVRIWMLVLGILECIGVISVIASGGGFADIVSTACGAALYIVGSVWINRNIQTPSMPVQGYTGIDDGNDGNPYNN